MTTRKSARLFAFLIILLTPLGASAARLRAIRRTALPVPQHVFVVVLENTSASEAIRQPFLAQLSKEGAYLANYYAVAHPSQPNYIALTSGSTWNKDTDSEVDLTVRHLGNLLNERGLGWKVYAESYPGNCFLGMTSSDPAGNYVRRHVPFLSYTDVQNDPAQCGRVVNAVELDADIASGALPAFSLYVPNNNDNGHDTSPAYADRWLQNRFGSLLSDPRFMTDMLFIVTFDEDDGGSNRVYTALYGTGVKGGTVSNTQYTHYSLLRLIEDRLGTSTLGQNDTTATSINDVWVR